jgi:hypothetical protein
MDWRFSNEVEENESKIGTIVRGVGLGDLERLEKT